MDKIKSVLEWLKDHIRVRCKDLQSAPDDCHLEDIPPKKATEIQLTFDF